ncbi:hypothetical protein KIPB_001577 [Kipferlia bialata]|uniref:Uncharacterized protein n=1 Tax=Kipferlia bialata TaxID=797122 RepID=A0A9K3CR02_9EUKA|nr:hypothetical protein KIPB_001577 [Kipferlia bialata]|eukprot:g1577.t1
MSPLSWFLSSEEVDIQWNPSTVVSIGHNTLLASDGTHIKRLEFELGGHKARCQVTDVGSILCTGGNVRLVGGEGKVFALGVRLDMKRSFNLRAGHLFIHTCNTDSDTLSPDTNSGKHDDTTVSPIPMIWFHSTIVDGHLVLFGGHREISRAGQKLGHSSDMWVLDTEAEAEGEGWSRVSLPASHSQGLSRCLYTYDTGSFLGFSWTDALRISLDGSVTREPVSYPNGDKWSVGKTVAMCEVGGGLCIFRAETIQPEGTRGTRVYMYDIVTNEVTLCEDLPSDGVVVSVCMLNPTTMLVVQPGALSIVKLDPLLADRWNTIDNLDSSTYDT